MGKKGLFWYKEVGIVLCTTLNTDTHAYLWIHPYLNLLEIEYLQKK